MDDFLRNNLLWLAGLLLGLILLGGGILSLRLFPAAESPKVEILGEQEILTSSTTIKVEIAGAVVKPGVYELTDGGRVNDLLLAAGGLAAEVDHDWLAKNVNLAQKLIDGTKIYLPAKNQSAGGGEKPERGISVANKSEDKINLNTASLKELDSLWGVGEVTAQKIIEGRPYSRPEELLERKIVKNNVWEEIKDKVSVY